jgi:hypothetical protein
VENEKTGSLVDACFLDVVLVLVVVLVLDGLVRVARMGPI